MEATSRRTPHLAIWGLWFSAVLLSSCLSGWANPEGGSVVAGGATISSAGATTTIQQSTDRAVIHWQGFSIAPGETTTFVQPAASSAVLNRVTSGDASQLMGTLQANGQVYLLNPNGIFIGNGAVIDVGSFLATTHNTDEDAFMRGGELTFTGPSTAAIRNEGTVRANGGDVYLLARKVENEGEIVAENGTVGLMAGTKFYLQSGGGAAPAVRVEVEESAAEGEETGVRNSGVIRAVQARLEAAGNLYALAVSQRGLVQATGTTERPDGTIVLAAPGGKLEQAGTLTVASVGEYGSEVAIRATEVTLDPASIITAAEKEGGRVKVEAEGTAWVQGKMDVTGTEGKGGKITVTGARVGLRGAELDASGAAGGGEILLGGDFQGKNPAVRNAERAFVSADSVIRADAVGKGNGGKVITWSDHGTLFYGEAFARGGAEGGDGGLIEVSGRDYLDFQGRANTLAPLGEAGMLLLDPLNLLISNIAPPVPPALGPGMNSDSTPFAPIASGATLSWQTIQDQLNLGNVVVTTVQTDGSESGDISIQGNRNISTDFNLTLDAAGDINFGTAIDDALPTAIDVISFSDGGSLILQANGSVFFNADLTVADAGNLRVRAGESIEDRSPPVNIPGPPPVVITFKPGRVSVSGDTYLTAGSDIILNRNTSHNSLQGEIDASGGSFFLDNGPTSIQFGEVSLVGVLNVSTSGSISQTVASSLVAPTASLISGGDVTLLSPGNNFGILGFPRVVGNVSIDDQNDIRFQTSTILGQLTLRAGRDINQSPPDDPDGPGVFNIQGPVIINAGRDIYLPLAGIGGNELAWGESLPGVGNVVTIERARDVFLGVQNELRLNVATAANFNPPIRNFTLRLREVDLQNSFEISGIATFAGTTDFSPIFIGSTAVAPPPGDFLQVTQQNLTRITSASEIRFGAHTYAPGTGVITDITQLADIRVANGIDFSSSTQILAGEGSLTTEGPLSLEIGQIGASRTANLTVVANQIAFNAPVTLLNGGVVTLRPFSRSLTIGLDPGVEPVDLDLSTSLASITGATSLVLGSLSQEGYFVVGSPGNDVSFNVPVIFQTGNNVGQLRLYNNLSTAGSSLQINGNLVVVNDAIISAGQTVGVSGNISGFQDFTQTLSFSAGNSVTLNSQNGSSTSNLAELNVNTSGVGGTASFAGALSEINAINVSASGAGGSATFGGNVSGIQTFDVSAGTVTFSQTVSDVGQLELGATSAIRLNGGTISTVEITDGSGNMLFPGSQSYQGPVQLGVNTTLNAEGNITFASSVNGLFSLTANTDAILAFNGQVGTTQALASLTTDAGGTTQINGGRLRATTQTYNDAVEMGNGQLVLFGETVNFNSTVDGSETNLLLGTSSSDAPNTFFRARIELGNLTSAGGGALSLLGGGVVAGATSLAGSSRNLLTIDSGNAATLMEFPGGLTLSGGFEGIRLGGGIRVGQVGSAAANSLTTDGFSISSDLVLTGLSGGILVTGAISGGVPDLVTVITPSGEEILVLPPAAARALTISSPGGVTFSAAVGQVVIGDESINSPLTSLTVGSILSLNGGLVLTEGNQNYQGLVTLGANTTVRTTAGSPAITFSQAVTGSGRILTLQDNTASSRGSITFLGSLNVGGLVTFGGEADYSVSILGGGSVGGTTVFANAGAITLGGGSLTTTFTGGLTATAPSAIRLAGGTIQTQGNAALVVGDSGSPITLQGGVVLSAGSGAVTLGGAVGSDPGPTSLAVTGGAIALNSGTVTTTGSQTYTGTITLGANSTLNAGAGNLVWFAGTLDGGRTLAIGGTSDARFDGVVGGATRLTSISVGGATLINAPAISTTGAQTYTGPVTLGTGTILTGNPVTFGATVDGRQKLAVVGNASFGGVVGDSASLGALSVSGTSVFGAGATAVTTSGMQSYTGTITGAGSPLSISAGSSVNLPSIINLGAVTIESGGRVTLSGSTYQTASLVVAARSLVNQTGTASPFSSPGVILVTDRPNSNSPNAFNGGFSDFGYAFLPALQVSSSGAAGTMVYRFFDAPGVATPLQYTETAQTFAYTAAVPVTGYAGPRPFAGEIRLGRIEGAAPTGQPGGTLQPLEEKNKIPAPPTQFSQNQPRYGSPFAQILITEREKAKAAEAQEKSRKVGVGRLKVPDTAQIPAPEIREIGGDRISQFPTR